MVLDQFVEDISFESKHKIINIKVLLGIVEIYLCSQG